MATVYNLNPALHAKHNAVPAALRSHINDAAQAAFDLARQEVRTDSSAADIDAIGALIADWANQLGVLVDEEQRVSAQYIRRLAAMLREEARSADPVRIQVLAWAILRALEPGGVPPPAQSA